MAIFGTDSNEDTPEGECVGETDSFSDADLLSAYTAMVDSSGSKVPWTQRAFARATARNRRIIYWPDQNPSDSKVTPECTESLRAAAPFWGSVDFILLDELDDRLENYLGPFESVMRAECGSVTPIIANFTVPFLRSGSAAAKAALVALKAGGHMPCLEAYIDPKFQNDPNIVTLIKDIILEQRAIIGNEPCGIVTQSYRQERSGVLWTNDNSLDSIVDEAFRQALADQWIRWVLCYIYSRKPNRGIRQIGQSDVPPSQWFKDSHAQWYQKLKA